MKNWLNIENLNYQTYEEYKDSKIEWIGKIPNHFKINKIKNYKHNIYGGITGKSGEDFSDVEKENYLPFIPFTNVFNNHIINLNHLNYYKHHENEKQNQIKNNDLLFLMSSEGYEDIGKSALYLNNTTMALNSFCKGLTIDNNIINSNYLLFLINSKTYRNYFKISSKGVTRINLKTEFIKNIVSTIPSKKEQLAIVKFLDEKTTIIDKKIEILKKQNKLEKELEKVLINQCVTKGVDSFTKLDKNGNLIDFENKLNRTKEKFDLYMNENGYIDSEIEWLGYIPNHYEIKRIKDLIKYVQSGTTPSSKDVETMSNQTINWFTPGDLNNNILINSKRKINQYSIDTNQVRIIKDKSILFSCVGEIGKIGISLNKTFSNQQITAIIPKKNVNLFYLYFLLKINKEYINSNAYETTLLQLNNNNLININNIIFINNLKEQLAIVKFLDNKTQMLEQKRIKREKEITLLEEYKKTLINDVVTGKIKVIKD